ncbi:hypothetical protein HY631_04155 [Candidatus Uhrbacteria bacterium]|nr:hypothetical protein [Candidatus Uhrbacteria bacterium]
MTSTEPVSVRDFLRNFAAIVQGKVSKRYVIMKHGKPIGVFTPWEVQKKDLKKSSGQQPWLWLDVLKKNQQPIGKGNITDEIDDIVYGLERNALSD